MFLPIRDDIPTVRTPYVTVALIVANSLIFLYSWFQGSNGFNNITVQYGFIPAELVHAVEVTPWMPASPWLTPFSSMFMHGGWIHLIGNMLMLWIYGNNVEDYFGPVRFVLFYIVSGLAAVGLYTLFDAGSMIPLVGASGAIAGVMGAYMVLYPKARVTVLIVFFFIQFVALPAKIVLGIWFAMQLFMSMTNVSAGGGVAWMAHVGGFAFGYGLLRLLVKVTGRGAPKGHRAYRVTWR